MLTGIEVAGLVLAVFPLVINALEYYEDGLQPIKEWVRFRGEYAAFMNALCRQKIFFRQNIEELLGPIVASDFEMAQLLDNPRGPGWKSEDLDMKLRKRLPGKYEYECYKTTAEYILQLLEKLKAKLNIANGQPHWSGISASSGKLHLKFEFKRISYTLDRKRRNKLMDDLEKHNAAIQRLLGNSEKLEPMRKKRRSPITKYFQQIRNQACSLHGALTRAWRCDDSTAHSTKLLLEKRIETDDSGIPDIFHSTSIKFNLFFCHQPNSWTWGAKDAHAGSEWCATEIKMVELSLDLVHTHFQKEGDKAQKKPETHVQRQGDLSASFPFEKSTGGKRVSFFEDRPKTTDETKRSAQEIEDLCLALKQPIGRKQNLGCLRDDQQRLHSVDFISNPQLTFCGAHRIVSLEEMLSKGPRESRPAFTRRNRLSLAVILANSLLQLHSGPWLQETWGKKDIYFLQSRDGVIHTTHPFLICHFNSKQDTAGRAGLDDGFRVGRPSSACNSSLLSLGIVILELWFNQTIESQPFRKDFLGPDGKENEYTSYNVAQKWQDYAMEEGGLDLHNPTRRCIHCAFGAVSQDLEDEDLRKAVFSDVVQPLEQLLARFEDTSSK